MKIARLYIENFMCYDKSLIDFDQFSAALVVGSQENNDMYANGVGKSTLFKALEYVLFNYSDMPLERVIRDDTTLCCVTLDFFIGDQEYRLSRSRTHKGSADLSLYQRTGSDGETSEKWHDDNGAPITDEKYWKDISGRRAADTEKDVTKLIKINHKSFRVFVHFRQHDFTGLTTATPEKRKGILKDALDLIAYSKMEKMAKERSSTMARQIDQYKASIETLGDPVEALGVTNEHLKKMEEQLSTCQSTIAEHQDGLDLLNKNVVALVDAHANVESKFSTLIEQEKTLMSDRSKLEISVKEYQSKKSNVVKAANDLVKELKELEGQQTALAQLEYSQIDILSAEIERQRNELAHHAATTQHTKKRYKELEIPMPDDGVCKHCRQALTKEHRKICQSQINKEMKDCLDVISLNEGQQKILSQDIEKNTLRINELSLSKQRLEGINTKMASKNQELQEKRNLHTEYSNLLTKFTDELVARNIEIDRIKEELKKSPVEEAAKLQFQLTEEKQKVTFLSGKIASLNKEVTTYSSNIAVLQHDIKRLTQDKSKKEVLIKLLQDTEVKYKAYPLVIKAFSSVGIPNIIIQNVLDDLQIEANSLLSQMKPGIQLAFAIEKTKDDGTDADTLDIKYQINGRDRYYEQLSGGQHMAINFSLKVGLSFLLQKTIGVDIKFLLLDELDQPLDKASQDAYADIIKFFQKDFKIMVVTHNDRLKDKFSHAILVEQDINMVSRAKVVSSW